MRTSLWAIFSSLPLLATGQWEIRQDHRPEGAKSFGSGSYVLPDPPHRVRTPPLSQATYSHGLQNEESQGVGFFLSENQKESDYYDQLLDNFNQPEDYDYLDEGDQEDMKHQEQAEYYDDGDYDQKAFNDDQYDIYGYEFSNIETSTTEEEEIPYPSAELLSDDAVQVDQPTDNVISMMEENDTEEIDEASSELALKNLLHFLMERYGRNLKDDRPSVLSPEARNQGRSGRSSGKSKVVEHHHHNFNEEHDHEHKHLELHEHDQEHEEEHLYYNTHTHKHKHDHFHEHAEMMEHNQDHKHLHNHTHSHTGHYAGHRARSNDEVEVE